MRKISAEELGIIIENHKHWIKEDCKGWENMEANLNYTDLSCANLEGIDLRYANLINANLEGANLTNANLNGAFLKGVNLTNANLDGAFLKGANLKGANLKGAYLVGANLKDANLRSTDFGNANLCDAIDVPFIPMTCPEEGSFIGYKKAHIRDGANTVIVKLEICEDARRSSATGRKCRCDKAKVISISSLDGSKTFDFAYSDYDDSFVYRVGKIVEEPNFCEDRFNECARGIHFFISKQEAVDYY